MKVEERIKILPKKNKKDDRFQVLILNKNATKNTYGGKILGRTLSDWVAFACQGYNIKVLDYNNQVGVLQFARANINSEYDFSLILLSSTPLINSTTIKSIVEYCKVKRINLCKLPTGYVVNNEYIINNQEISVDSLYSQNMDDFYLVENKKQFVYAEEVLQDRINSFHINNGVEIRKPKSVYIEPEVDIASGVIICSGNTIKGCSIIEENAILKENNVIQDSKVGMNSCVSGSVVTNSVIASNVYVSSFCVIDNSIIASDCTIGAGSKIYNYAINKNTKLKAGSVKGKEDDSDSRTGKSR